MRKVNPDLIIAIFLLSLESFLWNINLEIPAKAGFYPKYLLILAFTLTILLLVKAILVMKNKRTAEKVEKVSFAGHMKYVLFVILITVIYLFLINYLGYAISTFFYIFFLMWILGVRTIGMLILVPLLTTTALYLMFNHLLMVLLPKGIIFGG